MKEINVLRDTAMELHHSMCVARVEWQKKREVRWIGWIIARPAWWRYVRAAQAHRIAQRTFLVAFAKKCCSRMEGIDYGD